MSATDSNSPAKQSAHADCGLVPCSALAPMSFAAALESLPKKELIRLLTAVGQPPLTTRDRERSLLASRLARYADKITIVIKWDSRMPNKIVNTNLPVEVVQHARNFTIKSLA